MAMFSAPQFQAYIASENPDTSEVEVVGRHPAQVLQYLDTNFQAPRRRGAVFVNICGAEVPAPAPSPL